MQSPFSRHSIFFPSISLIAYASCIQRWFHLSFFVNQSIAYTFPSYSNYYINHVSCLVCSLCPTQMVPFHCLLKANVWRLVLNASLMHSNLASFKSIWSKSQRFLSAYQAPNLWYSLEQCRRRWPGAPHWSKSVSTKESDFL